MLSEVEQLHYYFRPANAPALAMQPWKNMSEKECRIQAKQTGTHFFQIQQRNRNQNKKGLSHEP